MAWRAKKRLACRSCRALRRQIHVALHLNALGRLQRARQALVLQQVVKAQRVAAARLEVRGIHDASVAHAPHGDIAWGYTIKTKKTGRL